MSSHACKITVAGPGEQQPVRRAARSGGPARQGVAVAAGDDTREPAPLDVSYRVCVSGDVVIDLGGELDIVSAEEAVSYVKGVIDRCGRPVVVDLSALAFCDARGLGALLRMAGYAERAGCEFRLASPQPSVVRIMRITGLDRRFLVPETYCPAGS
jgi:anti-anti-sigma factor